MSEITTVQHTVTTAEADFTGQLRISALVNLLIQSAGKSADSLGVGLQNLQLKGLFWGLNRLHLEIDAVPLWAAHVTIRTWPRQLKGVSYYRDFEVDDEKGHTIIRGTSVWLAIHRARKRPVVLNEGPDFNRLKNKLAGPEEVPKPPAITSGEVNRVLIRPGYFDIDLNGHVTTTRYIDWVMDQFSLDFHQHHCPKQFTIHFIREILPEEEISLKYQLHGQQWLFEGFKDDKAAFRMAAMFNKIQE